MHQFTVNSLQLTVDQNIKVIRRSIIHWKNCELLTDNRKP